MKIIIGIISYFPGDEEIRSTRIKWLNTLINKCNAVFNIPIYIIAQNYTREDAENFGSKDNVSLFEFPKLGITGARKQLRETFLNGDGDYLIMLDDDAMLRGVDKEFKLYLNEIRQHPGGWALKRSKLLKLLAISREVYEQLPFPDINPELNEGYEDAVFCYLLKTNFATKEFHFTSKIFDFSDSAHDPNST